MNTRKISSRQWRHFALTPLALAMAWTGAAHGAEYWLCAKSASVIMPGSVSVPMWGYALDSTGFAGNCTAPASVPGPELSVPVGEGLTVHLRNVDLPEPTSLVIPGQPAAMAPVWTDGTSGLRTSTSQRVRSFAAEATAGIDQTYSWATLKPGTYLYHSGTHPQVQVQMGLYGVAKHDAATGLAYAGVPYASEVTLLFSEIDPALHTAVTAIPSQYGPGLAMSSTIDYAPQYFLINGKVHTDTSPMNFPAGSAGQTTLLRLLNAGLQTRSPVLQGMHMRLVAEDGNPYSYAREQYSVFLPALKTVDAVLTPASAATYPIYDRRLAVTNPGPAGSTDGGMLAFLTVADAPSGTPTAVNDAYGTNEDTALVVAAPGVLANDTGATASLVSGTSHGSLSLAANGGFTYTPQPNYNGTDSFSYQAMNGSVGSVPATVSLTVSPVNDTPVAAANAYSVPAGTTLNVAVPGVLGNDSDVDGDPLTAILVSGPAAGTLTLNANGSFSYVATTAGSYSFTYQASDGTATSAAATVTFSVLANRPPVAVADTFAAAVCRATNPATPCAPRATVALAVLANDSDPDGNLYPATVTIVTPPNKGGTATVVGNGTNTVTVSYTPKLNFRGTENFSYRVSDSAGALSNIATVKVNVK
jgi:FtsP/CotA-like multicopper oxidase with cupredoxin domain